jgi:prepilin-type N-terminal cleavage/methylation domain-containing protein
MIRRPRHGFSLIELVLALGLSALVLTALMGLLLTTARTRRQAHEEARLLRAGDLAVLRLQRDLGFAGTGLPPGGERAVVALDDGLRLVGDLPAPGALYPTLGVLIPRDDGRGDLLMWRNGNRPGQDACGGGDCRSALFGPAEGCGRTGSGAEEGGSLFCPWASGRAQPFSTLHVVTAGGAIGRAAIDGPQLRLACPSGGACGLQLQGPVTTPSGTPLELGDELAWVTTPDAVRWWVEDGTLFRQQCRWLLGDGGGETVAPCAPRERVAAHVRALTLDDRGDHVIVTIALAAKVLGQEVAVRVVGGSAMRGWQ